MYPNADNDILNSTVIHFRNQPITIMPPFDPSSGVNYMELKPVAVVPVFEFLDNGDVVFNVSAPGVETVEVGGMRGTLWGYDKHPLEDQGNGWFRGTISGIPAGFQYMQYYFDGKPALYKDAPIGRGYGYAVNYIDIPDPELDFYLYKDVPHGAVRYETYYSKYTGNLRNCWVYTPPTYDTSPDKVYPTLYIQHGAGENETGWFWQGKINYIMDNLIAEGKAEEMIIVTNCGYADPADPAKKATMFSDLSELIISDCIPFIESRFRVKKEKKDRAMAGLSMGSFQTEYLCFNHPEVFDYIGVFSGSTGVVLPGAEPRRRLNIMDYDQFYDDPQFNSQHKLLYFGRGMGEGGENLPEEVENLRGRGVDCEYFTCDGVHEWQVWRKTARDFLPRLFR